MARHTARGHHHAQDAQEAKRRQDADRAREEMRRRLEKAGVPPADAHRISLLSFDVHARLLLDGKPL
jgi:hypothetical protein